jgi:hypothetical protein
VATRFSRWVRATEVTDLGYIGQQATGTRGGIDRGHDVGHADGAVGGHEVVSHVA